ncbi:MAG: ribonuclease III [Clostridia bacterium]|nr:ribonuclease III [Clostridia bacterium]
MTFDEKTVKQYNGTTLAYIGDAVTEIFMRTSLLLLGVTDTARSNGLALRFVTAHAQSDAVKALEGRLTEEEADVLRRGRNAKLTHRPKNQTQSDYRRATGFEALMGYLYLSGKADRARELFDLAYADILEGIKNKSF